MIGDDALARVRRRLDEEVPRWFGPGARLSALSGPQAHAWSCQFSLAVEVAGGRRELVVKIPRWEEAPTLQAALAAGPQESTRREYAALEAIAAVVGESRDPGLAAVTPVGYLPDLNAVVTERLASVPLHALLGTRPGAEGRQVEVLRRVGRVLRLYHERAAGAGPGRLDGTALAAELEAIAARPCLGGPSLREALEVVARQARKLDGRTVVMGATHGDFSLANVVVTPDGRVAILDPNLVDAPVLEDTAKLLIGLRMRRARAISLGLLGRVGLRLAELAFLEGYGPVDAALLRFFRAVAAARRGAEMEERLVGRSGLVRRPAAFLLGRYLSAELSRPAA